MNKEAKTVLISTFYEGSAVKKAILKLSPDKLILLIDEPFDLKKKELMYERLSSLKKAFSDVKESLLIETKKVSSYDLNEITSEVINIIDDESKQNNRVIVHITEGRKVTSLALLFAAYMRKDKIERAYYITEEEHKLLNLPLINIQFNGAKKALLKEISKNHANLDQIRKKTDLGKSATYQYIQELKQEGYLENDKEPKLTDLGRIMIL